MINNNIEIKIDSLNPVEILKIQPGKLYFVSATNGLFIKRDSKDNAPGFVTPILAPGSTFLCLENNESVKIVKFFVCESMTFVASRQERNYVGWIHYASFGFERKLCPLDKDSERIRRFVRKIFLNNRKVMLASSALHPLPAQSKNSNSNKFTVVAQGVQTTSMTNLFNNFSVEREKGKFRVIRKRGICKNGEVVRRSSKEKLMKKNFGRYLDKFYAF